MKKIILAFLLLIAYNASSAEITKDAKYPNLLLYDGVITVDEVKLVIKKYNKSPFQVLGIRSRGGSAVGGFMLADFVRSHNIGVYAIDYCDSACTFPFFNAKRRSINDNGTVTLHNTSAMIEDKVLYTQKDMVEVARAAAVVGANISILYLDAGIPISIVQSASTKFGSDGVTLNKKQLMTLNLIQK
jgi:hypothetical protein